MCHSRINVAFAGISSTRWSPFHGLSCHILRHHGRGVHQASRQNCQSDGQTFELDERRCTWNPCGQDARLGMAFYGNGGTAEKVGVFLLQTKYINNIELYILNVNIWLFTKERGDV